MTESLFTTRTLPEWALVAIIPLFSCVVGLYLARLISRRPKASRAVRILDFIAPMLCPLLTFSLTYAAIQFFRTYSVESNLLLMLAKLSAAWFSIILIRQMISKHIAGALVTLILVPIIILKLFDILDVTVDMLSDVKFTLGNVELNLYVIIKGLIALIVLQWFASLSIKLVDTRLQTMKSLRASSRTLIIKILSIFVYCFAFIFAMQLLGINLTALGVFGGALGVGLGFGLQKIASNFISGIILLFEKSLEIGDLIELTDGTVGYVRQTYARYTRVEMATGKELLIPNEEFINQRVISWTHTHKKAQIEVIIHVSYDADIGLARRLAIQAGEDYSWRLPNSETNCFLSAFNEIGVEMRLQFWVRDVTRGRMEPKSEVMFKVWESFKAHNISFPTPQRQVRVVNANPLDETTLLGADA